MKFIRDLIEKLFGEESIAESIMEKIKRVSGCEEEIEECD